MEEFLSAAREAAEAAGALIRQTWRESRQIFFKSAIDLVTTVDRQAEELIVDALQKRFPHHSILAEEKTAIERPSAFRWIVDPLDGTTNFAHAYPHIAVSIALERDGEVVLGVVYDPLRGELFTAAKEQGAYFNGAAIRTSKVNELDKALLPTGFPYDRREKAAFYLSFFEAFMIRSQGIRRNGTASLDLCYLACGRLDGFWELKLYPWDTAAGSIIVREAGGTVSDFSGRPFSIWADETLASNGIIHAEMLRVIAALNKVDSPRGG